MEQEEYDEDDDEIQCDELANLIENEQFYQKENQTEQE